MLRALPDQADAGGFTCQPVALAGHALLADSSGALYWPTERTLIVADLHLEKGSAAAARGRPLPPYDTRATLLRLSTAVERYRPAAVIALGDSLHDRGAAGRIGAEDLRCLRAMQRRRDWIWITGNHDPEIDGRMGGVSAHELSLAGVTLRHEPSARASASEIAGHLHPAAKVSLNGATLRRPCLVGDGRRLVLPAFGAFTGGLNVLDAAFRPLFGARGLSIWMLGRDGIYPARSRQLRPD